MTVKAADANSDALARPTDYTLIWADHGSGADRDGSCWRPVAPDGYVSLGDVFADGYGKPSLDDVMCVRADLVYMADIGPQIWADHGSGADKDIDTFAIITPPTYLDSNRGLFAVNSFVANNKYDKPKGAPVLHVLNLPFPTESHPEPQPPHLDSFSPPSSQTTPVLDHSVWVPFTAIKDDARDTAWKVQNSPFYRVDRYAAYKTEIYDHNQTSVTQKITESITTGISKSKEESFSVTTGISVTATSGVSFLGTGGEVSATVSVELGWQRSTNITQFREETLEYSIEVPPGRAQAIWSTNYELQVVREDGSNLPTRLIFDVDYFVHSEYPNGETTREIPARRERLNFN